MAGELLKVPDAPTESTLPEELGPTEWPIPDLPVLAPPASGRNMHIVIISVCNQKGEVRKTTTTISLGAALVELRHKVLLVDSDPQGSFSMGLGISPHTLGCSVHNLLLSHEYVADEVIQPASVEGVDILPNNIDLLATEVRLISGVVREQTPSRLLEPLHGKYGFILVDCAPSPGSLIINALTTSDYVIMLLECEFFALRGIALLTDTISRAFNRLSPNLKTPGTLSTMYDGRTPHPREVLGRVVQAFGNDVFHTVVRHTVKFPETIVASEPTTTYTPASKGADAYRMLAQEVLRKYR